MSKKLTKIIIMFAFFFSFVTFSAKAIDLEFYFPVAVGGSCCNNSRRIN